MITYDVPSVPPILGQILDLISPAKINISEPRFKSYNPWDMANCLLWYKTSILKVRIFYCKIPKNVVYFFVSGTWLRLPEYGSNSKFPSTGPSSQVQVQVPKYKSHTRDLFRFRFPSTGPGSQVRVQVSKYRFWEIRQKSPTLLKGVFSKPSGPDFLFLMLETSNFGYLLIFSKISK